MKYFRLSLNDKLVRELLCYRGHWAIAERCRYYFSKAAAAGSAPGGAGGGFSCCGTARRRMVTMTAAFCTRLSSSSAARSAAALAATFTGSGSVSRSESHLMSRSVSYTHLTLPTILLV